jgi:hypothetical protein
MKLDIEKFHKILDKLKCQVWVREVYGGEAFEDEFGMKNGVYVHIHVYDRITKMIPWARIALAVELINDNDLDTAVSLILELMRESIDNSRPKDKIPGYKGVTWAE